MTNDEQVEEFEKMQRRRKNRVMPSEDLDIPEDLLNNIAYESTKKVSPRPYNRKRKHFTKAQLVGFGLGVSVFLGIVGYTVNQGLAKDEIRKEVDPILTEYAANVTHDYEADFKKNDINVFYGFTPDGDKNIERDSSRNYRFMNEYFDGEADMEFFEYLTGRFGVDEVLKCGIQVSRTLKGVADQNDQTVEEFLGGKSPEKWAEDMYNLFIAQNVSSLEGKVL